MNEDKFIKAFPIPSLAEAVIENMGGWEAFEQSACDVARYGIQNGYGGFVYYNETVKFFKENRPDIKTLCRNQADDFDQDVGHMIAGFKCLGNEYSPNDCIDALYESDATEDFISIHNALACFAGEEVCRAYADMAADDDQDDQDDQD